MSLSCNVEIARFAFSDAMYSAMALTSKCSGYVSINFYFPESDTSLIVLENAMNDDSNIAYHFESEIRKIIAKSSLVKN